MAKIDKSGMVTLLKAFKKRSNLEKKDRFLCAKLDKNSKKARMAKRAKGTKMTKKAKVSTMA